MSDERWFIPLTFTPADGLRVDGETNTVVVFGENRAAMDRMIFHLMAAIMTLEDLRDA